MKKGDSRSLDYTGSSYGVSRDSTLGFEESIVGLGVVSRRV